MSRTGQYLARIAGGDGAVRRRIDVTRLFAVRPGERLTAGEVAEHTPGEVAKVRALLEELVGAGWLKSAKNADHRTVYWREETTRRV